LKLIGALVQALQTSEIRYCHWKSNINLGLAVEGVDDLDLLVLENDKEKFENLLVDCGFKQFSSAREHRTQGIFNFYGYDSDSGTFVHVHAHYELVLGHDLIKNYNLPVVDYYLDDLGESEGLPIPDPAKEYVLFVMRMVLKRRLLGWLLTGPRTWLKQVFAGGPFGLTGIDAKELVYLHKSSTEVDRLAALSQLAPGVSPEVFSKCESSLGIETGRFDRFATGSKLSGSLRKYAILHPLKASLLALGRRAAGLMDRLAGRAESRKKPRSGGRIFAIVGGDGAGKTTNIENLVQWLGKRFIVHYLHYGKPPRDLARILLGLFIRVASPVIGRDDEKHPAWIRALGYTLLARDRFRSMQWAVKRRSRGEIIVMDRIHVPGLKLMDSPQVENLPVEGPFYSRLAEIENEFYERTPLPDLHIVLRLDPEVAVLRKPEDGEEYVRTRNQQLWDVDWSSRDAFVLDGASPLEPLKATIQDKVWAMIPPRQRVVEILGVPGSGKSTVVKALMPLEPTLRTGISTRAFRKSLVCQMVARCGTIVSWQTHGVSLSVAWSMFVQETQLHLMQTRLKKENLKYGSFLLDEGPLAGLVWVNNETADTRGAGIVTPWLKKMINGWADVLDSVSVLDAPDEVLCQRINDRSDDHRIKGADSITSAAFLKNVRMSISHILDVSGGLLPSQRIDTHTCSPEDVVQKVSVKLELRSSHD